MCVFEEEDKETNPVYCTYDFFFFKNPILLLTIITVTLTGNCELASVRLHRGSHNFTSSNTAHHSLSLLSPLSADDGTGHLSSYQLLSPTCEVFTLTSLQCVLAESMPD